LLEKDQRNNSEKVDKPTAHAFDGMPHSESNNTAAVAGNPEYRDEAAVYESNAATAVTRATRRGHYTLSAASQPRGSSRMNAVGRFWGQQADDIRTSVAERVKDNRPVLKTLDDVKSMIPLMRLSNKWTLADRTQAKQNWANDGVHENKLNTESNGGLLTLYRVCLTFFRCLPEDILSPERSLEYDFAQNQTERRVWVSQFCELLAKLLFYPMFRQDIDRLTTAIQYVVIIVTNDCRPWKARLPQDCGPSHFLHKLHSVSQAASGRGLG
jgi:hypothetical protein